MWELPAFLFLCAALIIEKRINERALASFKAVVHVGGSRGKTSACRLVDAALRSRYRVFTKTTGTDARVINTAGEERPVKRHGPANIAEQLRIIRQARREDAEILVIESMAVKPELLRASQALIVKSTHSVVTSIRLDHILDMGGTLDEIERSLASLVPQGGQMFIGGEMRGDIIAERCERLGCRLIRCSADDPGQENHAVARETARSLGISDEEIDAGFTHALQDFGAHKMYKLNNLLFYNLFSVNDPESTLNLLKPYMGSGTRLAFLYNNRSDRPDRALLFAREFFPHFPGAAVYLIGGSKPLARRLFRQAGCRVFPYSPPRRALPPIGEALTSLDADILVGIGNIKGEAYEMIRRLDSEELSRG